MAITNKKILAFEYLLSRLLQWQKENGVTEGMTKVKALKLLFIVASIPVEGKDLLSIFDQFYAMPYGPVESDVYDAMVSDKLEYYDFTGVILQSKSTYKVANNLSDKDIRLINASIDCVKKMKKDLINMSAFDLVEYTHTWSCWQDAMFTAHILSIGSYLMSISDIRHNAKEIWG